MLSPRAIAEAAAAMKMMFSPASRTTLLLMKMPVINERPHSSSTHGRTMANESRANSLDYLREPSRENREKPPEREPVESVFG
jgi:hypothetical protein